MLLRKRAFFPGLRHFRVSRSHCISIPLLPKQELQYFNPTPKWALYSSICTQHLPQHKCEEDKKSSYPVALFWLYMHPPRISNRWPCVIMYISLTCISSLPQRFTVSPHKSFLVPHFLCCFPRLLRRTLPHSISSRLYPAQLKNISRTLRNTPQKYIGAVTSQSPKIQAKETKIKSADFRSTDAIIYIVLKNTSFMKQTKAVFTCYRNRRQWIRCASRHRWRP